MSRSLGQKKTACRFLEYCLTAGQTLLQLYMVMCLIGSVSRCDGESISLRRGGGSSRVYAPVEHSLSSSSSSSSLKTLLVQPA